MATPSGKAVRTLKIDILDTAGNTIGGIRSISPNHRRTVTKLRELDSEAEGDPFDIVPGVEDISLSVEGFALYSTQAERGTLHSRLQKGIPNSEKFKSLKQNKTPFNIKIKQVNESTGQEFTYVYQDCLLTAYSFNITLEGDVSVTERADIEVSKVVEEF